MKIKLFQLRSIHIVLFLLVCLLACKNKKIQNIDLNNAIELKGKKLEEILNLCHNDIIVNNNLLVLIDWCSENFFFHVFKYSPIKKLDAFGTKGRGPDEYISPFFFNSPVTSNAGLPFSVYDLNRGMIGNYHIKYNEDSSSVDIRSRNSIRIPGQIFPCFDLSFIDSCYYGNGLAAGEGLYFIYNVNTERKQWIDFRPKSFLNTQQGVGNIVFSNRIITNQDKNRIVVAMKHFNKIYFYDLEGRYSKSISIGENILPVMMKNNANVTDVSYIYALDLYGTKNFVYVLWGAQMKKDYVNNNVKNSFIIVLDWEGKHIKTYQIERSIMIGVNPDNTRLFATGVDNSGDTKILNYNLDHN